MTEIHIVVSSHYGMLSRGRHSARRVEKDGSVTWAGRDVCGRLVITEPGLWLLHSTDGFKRVARGALMVEEDGSWELRGPKFYVVDTPQEKKRLGTDTEH